MAVDLNPGTASWQPTIDANQDADEVFIGKAGNNFQQTADLRPGQKLLTEGGCDLDGRTSGGLNPIPTFANLLTNTAHGAEIGGLDPDNPPDVHNYAPGNQIAVVRLISASIAIRDVYCHDMILRDSFSGVSDELGWGVDMGEKTTLRRMEIAGMGKAGVNWSGPNGGLTTDPAIGNVFQNAETAGGLIDDSDIHNNGRSGPDCGGISKIVHGGKGRVIRNTRFWDNRRSHVWCDFLGNVSAANGIGVQGTWSRGWLTIEGCDFFDLGLGIGGSGGSLAEAIFLEVTSGVTVRFNRFRNNHSAGGGGLDGAQVVVHNGAFNTIEFNVFYDNGTRVMGCNQSARYRGDGKLTTVEGNVFRGNTIIVTADNVVFLTGLSQINGPPFDLVQGSGAGDWDALADGGNDWQEQDYQVLDTATPDFRLEPGTPESIDFAAWQAAGFDPAPGGQYSTFTAANTPPLPPIPSLAGAGRSVTARRHGRRSFRSRAYRTSGRR